MVLAQTIVGNGTPSNRLGRIPDHHRTSRVTMGVGLWVLASLAAPLGAIAQDTAPSTPADTPPSDEETDGPVLRIMNCMATATRDDVAWGHRYTYWLSGVAEFDAAGNMMPISDDHAGDWIVTITNSRFALPETHNVYPVQDDEMVPEFSFPAVSLDEWNALGQRPTSEYVTAFDYDEAAHGLYLGIRNTVVEDSPRQLFQVVHLISATDAIRSDVSACFVGPRPMVLGFRGL